MMEEEEEGGGRMVASAVYPNVYVIQSCILIIDPLQLMLLFFWLFFYIKKLETKIPFSLSHFMWKSQLAYMSYF
jgi:hypothetical protein